MISVIIILAMLIIAVTILINILIIRAICTYQAKQNAAHFDYDYLAERIAAEIYVRLRWMEEQKTANKSATGSAAEPNPGNRTGAPEQNDSRQT